MKAYEVLEQYDWCKRSYATDEHGRSVTINDPSACYFCTMGAIIKAYDADIVQRIDAANLVRLTLSQRYNTRRIATWNDDPKRTKDEVVSLLKELDI